VRWFKIEVEKDIPENFKLKFTNIMQRYKENNIDKFQNLNLINQKNLKNYSNNFPENMTNQSSSKTTIMSLKNDELIINESQFDNNSCKNFKNNFYLNSFGNKNNLIVNNISNNQIEHNGNNYNIKASNIIVNNNQDYLNSKIAYGRKNSGNSIVDNEENKYQQQGKFTCRFDLQIDNDKEFQVARRLIGSKV